MVAVTVDNVELCAVRIFTAIRGAWLKNQTESVATFATFSNGGSIQRQHNKKIDANTLSRIIEVLPVSVLQRLADLATETPWLALRIRFVIAFGHLRSFA